MNTSVHIPRLVEPVGPHGKLLRAVGAVGAARASLLALVSWASRQAPAAIGKMTRAQEAAATREYAVQFFRSDPRFAAELCAAADRHERDENA